MTADSEPTRVLLVDDHDLIRDGLAGSLRAGGRHGGGRRGQDGAGGPRLDAALLPDVIVTDLQLQDGTGLDIVRRVRKERSEAGLVVLTMHSGDDQIFAAMEAGASAFVGKDAPSSEVVKAARHAAISPRSFLCAGLTDAVMRRTSAESTRLTDREHQVLLLLADGLSAAEIGGEAAPERVDREVARRPHLPEAGRGQPGPGPGHRDADWPALQHRHLNGTRGRHSPNGLCECGRTPDPVT